MPEFRSANRQAAYENGASHYLPEKACKRGHVSLRRVGDGCCQECNRDAVKKWRKKTGYKSDPEKIAAWRARQSPERLKSYEKTRCAARVYERNIRKRAKLRNACPKWLTDEQRKLIDAVYKKARALSADTGTKHEVDHILPICGAAVCGLHVPWNLQILSKAENRKKYNKMENYYE